MVCFPEVQVKAQAEFYKPSRLFGLLQLLSWRPANFPNLWIRMGKLSSLLINIMMALFGELSHASGVDLVPVSDHSWNSRPLPSSGMDVGHQGCVALDEFTGRSFERRRRRGKRSKDCFCSSTVSAYDYNAAFHKKRSDDLLHLRHWSRLENV